MIKNFPKLYSRTSNGAIQEWNIVAEDDTFYTVEGLKGGKMTTSKPTICQGKNTGKANETSAQEQAQKEAKAKWDKKIREGYVTDEKNVDNFCFVEPMLAKKFSDRKDKIEYPVLVDLKYNGVRCLRWSKGAFSRKGKEFFTIPHIIDETAELVKKFPSLVLDGELYNYELRDALNRLVKLVSVGRKAKDLTADVLSESKKIVQYHVYDGYGWIDSKYGEITEDTVCSKRREALHRLLKGFKYVFVAKTQTANNEAEVAKIVDEFIADGQEGGIVRIDGPYEHKRSNNLLKVKRFVDEEFEIIGIEEGDGNWTGCAKRIICKTNKPTKDGKDDFASNVEGTMDFCRDIFKNKKKYIGKVITVRYQGYSEYGRPQIPYTDMVVRDYE